MNTRFRSPFHSSIIDILVIIAFTCCGCFLFVYLAPGLSNKSDDSENQDNVFDVVADGRLIHQNLRLNAANVTQKFAECDIFGELQLYPSVYGFKSCYMFHVESEDYYQFAAICETKTDSVVKKAAFLQLLNYASLACLIHGNVLNCVLSPDPRLVCDCNGMCNEDTVFKNLPISSPTKSRKVFSFSLSGSSISGTCGTLRQIRLAKIFFPGWKSRIYIDESVPSNIVEVLRKEAEVIIIKADDKLASRNKLLRLLVAEDKSVDVYCIRDTDAVFSYRESLAINEWLDSGKGFNTMNDHPEQTSVMSPGGWCGRKRIRRMRSMIESHKASDEQQFLTNTIWPLIKDDIFAHDSFPELRQQAIETHSFPIERLGCEFFGMAIGEESDFTKPNTLIRESYVASKDVFIAGFKAKNFIFAIFQL